MKNVCLIILSLLFLNVSFAQTKRTKSSISISHEEKKFFLDARFSVAIDDETRAAIVEEISKVLEIKPEVRSNNAYVWEDASAVSPNYVFRLNKKRCNIKITKKGLNRWRYDELCDLGEEVGKLLSERNQSHGETTTGNSCITKTETKTHSSSSTNNSENDLLNFAIASSDRGEPTAVAINENEASLDFVATFSEAMSETIVTKIKAAVNDTSTGDYEKQVWKDNKAEGGYLIELEGRQCNINLNKETLSAVTFEKLEKLCVDLANLISNGGK